MNLSACLRPLLLFFIAQALHADGLPASRLSERQDVQAFISEMVKKHDWDRQSLVELFDATNLRPAIIGALDKPSTSRAWYQFHPSFLTPQKIRSGVAFWRKHEAWLTKAHGKYGVPEEIIVAIIGVETDYGRNLGRYRAMDALATIAFDYPRRGEYFRQELEQLLLLAREENIDPLDLQSSYAGALGWPQFMPGSFRKYAVDFDGDGRRDIWRNSADVIGSIAYYFAKFGWQRDGLIAVEANAHRAAVDALAADRFNLNHSVADLQALGVTTQHALAGDQSALVFNLETAPGQFQPWIGLNNFYVITRYNKSINYAQTVFRLSQQLRQGYTQGQTNAAK